MAGPTDEGCVDVAGEPVQAGTVRQESKVVVARSAQGNFLPGQMDGGGATGSSTSAGGVLNGLFFVFVVCGGVDCLSFRHAVNT